VGEVVAEAVVVAEERGCGEENEGRREFGSDIDVEGSTHISSFFSFI